ncbi:MAG: sigma 54-interacting transcriptional regulator [Deltaproteobacteria bacterium]|nr:sigma 54-interacting transcriptional regulator [Deltaproteobacteria bacterium]
MGVLPETKEPFSISFVLDGLLDELPFGIVVLDLKQRIVFLNRAMEALTGFSCDEATGSPCSHILRIRACIQGCPVRGLGDEYDSRCVESDMINRERQLIPIRITVAALRDPDGVVTGFVESVEDLRPLKELVQKKGQAYSFGQIIGRSPKMEKIFHLLPLLAQSDSSVLITGETGTGKDLVAEEIHRSSDRAKGPFVKVNCGALPETLLESELFGHQKGAFTGATESRPGRFRMAHNGTLYLTEIGDLPLALQVKLLTFLDDKIVYPLGSTRGFRANVRVIAATNRDLERMVKEGKFREDLLFRLNVVRVHLPPLRERGEDVRLLLDHFLNAFAAQFGKKIKGFSSKSLELLTGYSYPGNVRELKNVVEYAVNICQGTVILPRHLPAYLTETAPSPTSPSSGEEMDSGPFVSSLGQGVGEDPGQTWASMEKRMIMDALLKARGRRNKAASLLGWGRSTLWRKMKQHGIG